MTSAWKILTTSLLALCISYLWMNYFTWVSSADVCHKRPMQLQARLSSMTPYRFVANEDDSPIVFNGCQAVSLWGAFRHGTRTPSRKLIKNGAIILPPLKEEIVNNYRAGKGSLCASDISHLQEWEMSLREEDSHVLIKEGGNELLNLGKRFKNRFPELFPQPYNESYYKFYHTSTTRTRESAANFSVGLFGEEEATRVKFEDPSKSDFFLRFYKFCDKWNIEVKQAASAQLDRTTFENGPELTQVRQRVSERLGFTEPLSIEAVTSMYVFCAFGVAWDDPKLSAWCSPFTEYDLEVMQYAKDLNHYSKSGYKTEITYKQACPMMKNALEFLSHSGNDKPTVQLNFAHSGTILKFLAHLGLYKNPLHLSGANFSTGRDREWKGSTIDTFAANIVFVLYDGERKVLTLHQEREVTLLGCPKTPELCPLDSVLKQYENSINKCDFAAMCSVTGNGTSSNA